MIEKTRVPPHRVWNAWERAHATHSNGILISGHKGYMETPAKKKIPYEIVDVVPGKAFSIKWNAFLVKFIFIHKVTAAGSGSEVTYDFKIVGPLGWMVRWLIAPKIRTNITSVLKSFVRNLEMSY